MYSCPLPSTCVCNKLYTTKLLRKHQLPRQEYLLPTNILECPLPSNLTHLILKPIISYNPKQSFQDTTGSQAIIIAFQTPNRVHPHKPPGSKHLAPLLTSHYQYSSTNKDVPGASENSFPSHSSLTSQIQDNTSHPITPVQTLPPWHNRLAPRASQLRRQQPHQTTQVKAFESSRPPHKSSHLSRRSRKLSC